MPDENASGDTLRLLLRVRARPAEITEPEEWPVEGCLQFDMGLGGRSLELTFQCDRPVDQGKIPTILQLLEQMLRSCREDLRLYYVRLGEKNKWIEVGLEKRDKIVDPCRRIAALLKSHYWFPVGRPQVHLLDQGGRRAELVIGEAALHGLQPESS